MERDLWIGLRSAVDGIEPGAELVTPVSARRFSIDAIESDRFVVRFRDSGEERSLHREHFEALVDRLDDGSIRVEALQPSVEPYAAALTLTSEFEAADGRLERVDDGHADGESPYLVSAADARTRPRRVHDDALVLADLLDRIDADRPESLDTEALTDLYVLCSDVQRGSDRLRRTAKASLLDRLGPDQQLHGRFGTVRRTTRERRSAKDDEAVLDALDEHDVPREWVLGVDDEKLDVVVSVTDIDAEAVFDVAESVYVQKTGVDEGEKGARLQGMLDRLAELDGADEAEASIREDLDEIEDRLEAALAAG